MSDNMEDLFSKVKKMVDSGNIPNDIQQMMNNLQNSNNNTDDVLNKISPEMINNLNNMLNSNNQSNPNSSNNSNNSNNFNIDMNTIMKMQSIMKQMNNTNDPRANLLYSLKPYLRDSKKNKLDQYVNLLNISKIADAMNQNNKENKNE